MKKNKEYTISSFEELCNVANKDNINILSVDLANWLVSYVTMIENIKKIVPKQTKKLKNYEIAKGYFTWIDDGKNDCKGIKIEFEK
jgi:hypothetical protein